MLSRSLRGSSSLLRISMPLYPPGAVPLCNRWPSLSMASPRCSEHTDTRLWPGATSKQLPTRHQCDLASLLQPKISRMELNVSLAKKEVWFLIVFQPRTSLPVCGVNKHTHIHFVSVIHCVCVFISACSDLTCVVAHQARTWKLWVAADVERRFFYFLFWLALLYLTKTSQQTFS